MFIPTRNYNYHFSFISTTNETLLYFYLYTITNFSTKNCAMEVFPIDRLQIVTYSQAGSNHRLQLYLSSTGTMNFHVIYDNKSSYHFRVFGWSFFNRSQKWNPSCNQPFGTVILGSLSTFQMITSPLHLTLSEDAEAVEDISLKQRSAEQWQ